MIEMTCCCCGWDGRARERHAGLRVACKRCGAHNVVPPQTDEVYVADWLAAIDARTESVTLEVDIGGWPVAPV